MSEDGEDRSKREVVYNMDGILDAHTHLTGQESAEGILECMDFCGVEKVFLFAPHAQRPGSRSHQPIAWTPWWRWTTCSGLLRRDLWPGARSMSFPKSPRPRATHC
jgi:hypothetical protein